MNYTRINEFFFQFLLVGLGHRQFSPSRPFPPKGHRYSRVPFDTFRAVLSFVAHSATAELPVTRETMRSEALSTLFLQIFSFLFAHIKKMHYLCGRKGFDAFAVPS